MRTILLISLLAIIVVILLFFLFYPAGILISPTYQQNSQGYVRIEDNYFQVMLAKTEPQREKGLMGVKELDKDKGMLFIFDKEGIYPFWMKNTLIPLDIIWINSDGIVVFISQNVQPCLPAQAGKTLICPNVIPPATAKYVLEVNAGICEEIGLKRGDHLELGINLSK